MLEKMKLWLTKPLHAAIAAFIAGLFIGLVILGWWLWPVQWYDASPSDLRPDAQQDYVCMMIDSYSVNQNGSLAVRRYAELGDDGPALVAGTTPANCPGVSQEAISSFQSVLKVAPGTANTAAPQAAAPTAAAGQGTAPAATPAGGTKPTQAQTSSGSKNSSSFLLLGLLCLVTLGVGAAAFYLFVLKPRKDSGNSYSGKSFPSGGGGAAPAAGVSPSEEPTAQFITTYMIGDDLYDDSFSIDAPSGEFLGECGVGISEALAPGEPKRVTAFEVWLFDKNDIQTVTKMLMSKYAFNDPAIRQRLLPKGELLSVVAGQRVVLETASLRLEAHVVDTNYTQATSPSEAAFDRLTLELSVWQKK
jgi:hypothetical protein